MKIYLGDLLSRRFSVQRLEDDSRPKGRLVPLINNQRIDLKRLLHDLPFSTRRSLRKRLPLMNRNLQKILRPSTAASCAPSSPRRRRRPTWRATRDNFRFMTATGR